MNNRNIAAVLASLCCTAVLAQPAMPKRQSGLWEMLVDGRPTGMSSCVDQARDDVVTPLLASESSAAQCSRTPLRREAADRVVLESVCTTPAQTKTVRVVFTGDFQRQITATLSTTFDPPKKGRAPREHRFEMRWTGACPAGTQHGQMMPTPAR